MPGQYDEKSFEDSIEQYILTKGGYLKGDNNNFDKSKCIDSNILINFIKETQLKLWEYLQNILKERTEETIINDLCRALDSEHEGCLKVLRHGFKCYGKLLKVAFFKPASGLNPETQKLYDTNKLTVTRQLNYSSEHNKSIDMVLSLNGIPIVTLELKNPLTGQTWENAVHQYKTDRDQKDLIFQFKKRTLVHFAVDPDEVRMTTKLSGNSTYFLPFNIGDKMGAGNPDNPDGHKTYYLWENILQRDSILDIISNFIHLEIDEKNVGGKVIKKEKMIFPRYHQLDSVRELVDDAKKNGAGNNYLVKHSAGSGKSNSIAWLAYRLSSLHNDKDEKVFDSVVVVTDRIVLDQQLQNTIYQFEHKEGVVNKIEKDSEQLANSLTSGGPIIITTIQKFPFVTEKIGKLPSRKYAVIIDEAHSSQGGEIAKEMKKVLSGESILEKIEEQSEEEELFDYQEEILKTMAARGKQPNISFFAFTATPKYKTLEVFGTPNDDGKPKPFHLYSMRQAIEEKFILDVLMHYTTYKRYFKLIKSIEDDPKVDKKKAAKAVARFLNEHPHNIAQKTQIMVEHFQNSVRNRIGGKAKAMVVTASRLQAVLYKKAIDKYIEEKGYPNIKTLVAFSGTVHDPDMPDIDYTEVKMNNNIKEKELPDKFATDEYQILIVAEKFQTGFDQPLLHTMYVDKRLKDLHAVQTLSRLNRTHPGKDDTFVLDFVNETEEIKGAFQPHYEQTTVGERAEYSQLYELYAKISGFKVFFETEVNEFAKVFFKPIENQRPSDHSKLNACIDPAVNRFKQAEIEIQEEFRKSTIAYRNLYSFLAQVIPFQDPDLEKFYSYIRFLLLKLPKRETDTLHMDDQLALKYYRLEKGEEISIELEKSCEGELKGPTEVGTGKVRDTEIELSKIIDILNERFGTNFKISDQLFFDSIREDAMSNSELRKFALANTEEGFSYAFFEALEDILIERMEQNEEIAAKFFNEEEFREIVSKNLLKQVYKRIREEEKA